MKQLLWIDGIWVEGNAYMELFSPYKQTKIAEVAKADANQVKAAIDSASRAFEITRKMPAHKRADILEKVSDLIKQDRKECAELIAKEAGKPLKYALAEVDRTIMTYKFASEEARRLYGETVPLDAAPGGEGRVSYTVKEPIGVIAGITPFNFPMNLVAHKIGPAIASGNTIVIKPASQTPLSSYKIAEYFHMAGLPEGALNVISGSGGEIGEILTKDDRVKMITFTGSPSVGESIRSQAGLKKVTLELGSNSAVIVDADTDIEWIVPRIVNGAFSYQGQVCISIQRVFVHESIYNPFVEMLVEETKKLTIGDPLSMDTDVSPMISDKDTDRALSWIHKAVEKGASLAAGGQVKEGTLEPSILLNVPLNQEVSCEEVFAPVVHVNSFSDFSEAINMVNQSKYGLQAGVFTKDVNKAFKAARELYVGGVMVNDIPTFRVDNMPYGGVKMSGMGREGIKYAVDEMTELKFVSFKLA
jgi:acyl-CoA reductase-like NAD-dependent aldehyde dehydrogenase